MHHDPWNPEIKNGRVLVREDDELLAAPARMEWERRAIGGGSIHIRALKHNHKLASFSELHIVANQWIQAQIQLAVRKVEAAVYGEQADGLYRLLLEVLQGRHVPFPEQKRGKLGKMGEIGGKGQLKSSGLNKDQRLAYNGRCRRGGTSASKLSPESGNLGLLHSCVK